MTTPRPDKIDQAIELLTLYRKARSMEPFIVTAAERAARNTDVAVLDQVLDLLTGRWPEATPAEKYSRDAERHGMWPFVTEDGAPDYESNPVPTRTWDPRIDTYDLGWEGFSPWT